MPFPDKHQTREDELKGERGQRRREREYGRNTPLPSPSPPPETGLLEFCGRGHERGGLAGMAAALPQEEILRWREED